MHQQLFKANTVKVVGAWGLDSLHKMANPNHAGNSKNSYNGSIIFHRKFVTLCHPI